MIDKIVEECINVINEDIETLNEYSCPSRTPYVILFIVFLLISVIVGSVFAYYYYYYRSRDKSKKLDHAYVDYSITGKVDY